MIPYSIRTKMGLKPKTKLLVYGSEDTLILKKLYVPDLKEQCEKIKKIMAERNKKYGELTEEEIAAEVKAYRRDQDAKRKS